MQPRAAALLFVVALALGAFVWLYEIRGGETRKEAEAAAKRLFPGIEAKDVEWIVLSTSDGRSARLERREGAWQLVEPLAYPADEIHADGMASTLAELSSEGTIDAPQPPAVYGLDDLNRVVRFSAKGLEHRLAIGHKTPVGANTYAAADDASKVYTVPTYRVSGFQRSLEDLRERRVLRFDRAAIERVELSWPGGGAELARDGDGWRLTAPIEGPADATTVDTLLSDLSFLRAEGFVDAPPPDAESGLDRPELRVVLHGKAPEEGKEAVRFELVVGPSRDGKERLVRGQGPALFRVAQERLADFPRTLVAYRFKELASFDPGAADRVELVFHDTGEATTRVLQRGERGWTSDPDPVDPAKAARLVSELSRLRAIDIVGDAPSAEQLARLGLAPPRVVLRVHGAAPPEGEAPLLAEVSLGEVDAEGIAARRGGSDAVYRISPGLAEHLPVGLDAWRNRFVAKPQAGESGAAAPDAGEAAPDAGEAEPEGGAAEEPGGLAVPEEGGAEGGAAQEP